MQKIKLAVVYQVIFHYRIPFYKEIENDPEIDYQLFHGSGAKKSKVQNAKNDLKHTSKLFTLQFPYKQNGQRKYFSFFPFLFFKLIVTNPDVILLEGASSIINNVSAYSYAKIFRKKIIFWSLGKVLSKESSVSRKKIDKFVLLLEKKADAIFTYSSVGEAYFLSRGIPKEKIFKGINVLDTRQILTLTKPKRTNQEFRLLFVGSIIPEKKLEILIESFLKLEANFSNVYLDIIGSGEQYYTSLKEKYEHVSKNMIFHGRITEGLDSYYFNSDVFVLPGLGGLAISESMAYGLPVICTHADGTEKDLVDSSCGFFIDNMNSDTLYDQLVTLYNDRDHLLTSGMNAKAKIATKCSFQNYFETFKNSLNYAYEN